MHGQLNYVLAQGHVADLARAVERARFARSARRESFLDHVIAHLRARERPIIDRAPRTMSATEPATAASDAAVARS